jgi:hypothetical protein
VKEEKYQRIIPRVLGAWLALPFLILAAGAASPASPEPPESIDKTIDTTPNPRISLFNPAGRIVVTGWERASVHIVSSTSSPDLEIDIDELPAIGRADKIHLTTHVLKTPVNPHKEDADYRLEVPSNCDLDIRNPEGSIRIEKIYGEASLDSVGGTIFVTDASGHLAVRSIGGDIELLRPSGRVEVSSVNGNLRFLSPTSLKLRASTTSGKILYEGDFLSGGDYQFSDYSGDMEILTPPSGSFELNAKTVRGKVVADPELSVTPRRHSASSVYGGNGLFGTHNTGAATVELRSFSGAIRIRRLQ